ncbi:MAG: Xaa-Pro aminopeptidase [Rhodocyclaceae bacterium]|nr:Xaa-Pro aminopeptidase [Rhodocyclaceae bacterium]
MNIEAYTRRRAELARRMGTGVAVIATAPERARNRDTHYPYRHDSYFYYLTGFTEPEAVLVLVAGENPKSLLFCRNKDIEREIWDGYRYGPDAARAAFCFDEAYPIAQLDERLTDLIANQPTLFYAMGADADWDAHMMAALNRVRAQVRAGVHAPGEIRDIYAMLDDMRLIKDSHEVEVMRRAAAISCAAHARAMRATRPGRHEYEIEAELLHEFRRAGSQFPAYGSIVASGPNACVLHYVSNDRRMADGDLLLIDAGCELDGYASDITRTFPVNGVFSGAQRDIYQLVLDAQSAAMTRLVPGASFIDYHDAAVEVLARGMVELGLLPGTYEQVMENESYKRFYMHRTGHWLGMDVHDAGEYKRAANWRKLEDGMVLTVEPGCYVRPAEDVPQAFWNIGVRIEDDVVVRAGGNEILTAAAPKSIADIETLMAGALEAA